MKKILLPVLVFLFSFVPKVDAQCSMTVINLSPCDATVYLAATFEYFGFTTCHYETNQFVVPAGGPPVSAPSYWDWHLSVVPFMGGAPPLPLMAGGPAPNYGTFGCFEWQGAVIFPGGYPGVPIPPVNGASSPCGPAQSAGTICTGGAPLPGSRATWVNTGGNVTLTIY